MLVARFVSGGRGRRQKPLSGAHSLVQSPIFVHAVPPAPGPSLPQSLHGTVTGVCTFFPSFSLFFPLSPNNPGHVSPHPVFPFGFCIVSRHGDEAPSPPHPFCCLVVLYCFGDPLFCFLAFFSSRSFGSFSLTCPRMQQPDFRDVDPYRSPHAKDTDPAFSRSYKTCRPEENDTYATEVRCRRGAASPRPAGSGTGLWGWDWPS